MNDQPDDAVEENIEQIEEVDEGVEYRQHRFVATGGTTVVYLVRHGESAAVAEGREIPKYNGQDDPDLAPIGRAQAERVCQRLTTMGVQAIYVTPLRRTAQTAQLLAAELGIEPVVEPDLREVHLGNWEDGAFRRNTSEGHALAAEVFKSERWDLIPGAEPQDDFAARVQAGLNRVAEAHPDQRVAVFAHGGVIGMLLSLATSSRPFAFVGADNASISELWITPRQWLVRRFNDTVHLEGLE